jgi:hypothetical protein
MRLRRQKEHSYEAEESKEKDPATREASTRKPEETGQAKAETAGGRVSKEDESGKEIGRPRDCTQREENEQCQESEAKTESLTGTSRATFGGDESQVGCQKGRWVGREKRIER